MPIGQSFSTVTSKVYSIGTTPVKITAGNSNLFYMLMTIPHTNTGNIYIHRGPVNPSGVGLHPSDVVVGQGIVLNQCCTWFQISNDDMYRGSVWAIADTAGQELAVSSDLILE